MTPGSYFGFKRGCRREPQTCDHVPLRSEVPMSSWTRRGGGPSLPTPTHSRNRGSRSSSLRIAARRRGARGFGSDRMNGMHSGKRGLPREPDYLEIQAACSLDGRT
jgi:hypothetical protein